MSIAHPVNDTAFRQWGPDAAREAAFADETPAHRLYCEVQYHNHEAINYGGRHYPAVRYWRVEVMAWTTDRPALTHHQARTFPTFAAALAAGQQFVQDAQSFLAAQQQQEAA